MFPFTAFEIQPAQDNLRTMLDGWANRYTDDQVIRRRLVQITIDTVINEPDLLQARCLKSILFGAMHKTALKELFRADKALETL